MIFYFTGTGNSLKASKILKEETGEDIVFMSSENIGMKIKDDKLGFVIPVYCYDSPNFISEFIKSLDIPKNTYCYAIANCGAEAGNTLYTIDSILREKGLELSYGRELVLPDNCGPMLDHKPDLSPLKEGYERLKEFGREINSKVINKDLVKLDESIVEKIEMSKEHVKNEWTYKESIEERCILCNDCVDLCPTDNIIREDDKIIFKDKCVNCLACTHWCPTQAIRLRDSVWEKDDSYTNPDITYDEMIKNNK